MEINNYATPTAASGATTQSSLPAPNTDQSLSIDDFLSLLAAQLQNQDMMNPMTDTEYISQMAQFTALELQQATAQITSTQFAVGLMGQEVLAVSIDPKTGAMEQTRGVVEGVSLYEGAPLLYVDGKPFGTGQIMTLGEVEIPILITEKEVKRLDETSAKIEFTSSMEGEYYIQTVAKGAEVPEFDTTVAGKKFERLDVVENVTVTKDATDVYLVIKGKDGTISSPQKFEVPAFKEETPE